jgi:hypothetical protein
LARNTLSLTWEPWNETSVLYVSSLLNNGIRSSKLVELMVPPELVRRLRFNDKLGEAISLKEPTAWKQSH